MSGTGVRHSKPCWLEQNAELQVEPRSCLPNPAVIGIDEGKVEGCSDGS